MYFVISNGAAATTEAEAAAKPLNAKVAAKKRTADDMSPVSEAPSSKKGRRSISTLSQVLRYNVARNDYFQNYIFV